MVVTELDSARAQALSTADPAPLDRVYTTSAAQRAADAAVVADLAARGLRVRDGTHQIASATLIPAAVPVAGTGNAGTGTAGTGTAGADPPGAGAGPGVPDQPGGALLQVAVVDALPSYPIVDQAGSTVGRTVARPEERRILVLAPTGQGYRIDAILPG